MRGFRYRLKTAAVAIATATTRYIIRPDIVPQGDELDDEDGRQQYPQDNA